MKFGTHHEPAWEHPADHYDGPDEGSIEIPGQRDIFGGEIALVDGEDES